MSDPDQAPRQPRHGAAARAAKAAREARLADAMRDNLRKRRRQQAERRTAAKSGVLKPSSTS
jgi:hypothetical protein